MNEDSLAGRCAKAIERMWPCVYGGRDGCQTALEIVERGVSMSPPGWRSAISDDHTPLELSISQQPEGAELRLLFEVAGDDAGVGAQGRAALKLTPWLRERFGVNTDRLDLIAPLFLPEAHQGSFGLWHAAIFKRDGSVRFKVYLDPTAHGRHRAADVVERALAALSMSEAWPHVAQLAGRGPGLDEISFFSLDLADPALARTKVYVSRRNMGFEDLRATAGLVEHGDPDGLLSHTRAVAGPDGVLAAARPLVSCLAFVGAAPRPQQVTVHVPVRAYAPHDGAARRRVVAALESAGYGAQPLECALEAFAQRPLEAGSGMIPYVSHCAMEGATRITTYLSLEALAVSPPHDEVRPVPVSPVTGTAPRAVRRYADEPITFHPFLQRLAREPLAMQRLAMVLLNFQRGITRDFSRRLAQTVAGVDDLAVRSILAKQLNDELGNGKPDEAHSLLFDRFVEGMRPHAPDPAPSGLLSPGQRLGETLEAIFVTEPDAWVAVGASLMMEVFGEQVDCFLGEQFRRQSELPDSVMHWLSLHEELEHDHVEEVFELADRIPDGPPTEAALRGVQALATAGWRFFDDLYQLAWPA